MDGESLQKNLLAQEEQHGGWACERDTKASRRMGRVALEENPRSSPG
jgi:hypothetical protein